MRNVDINISENKININILSSYIGQEYNPELCKVIIIPKSFKTSDKLKYIRRVMKTIIKEYNLSKANVYTVDTTEENIIDIIKIEGVIEELLNDREVEEWK